MRRKWLTLLIVLALAPATGACGGDGRTILASTLSLDSGGDAPVCDGTFALGSILSDPMPLQEIAGNRAIFDGDTERMSVIGFNPSLSQAVSLEIESGGDYVDGATPAVNNGNLSTPMGAASPIIVLQSGTPSIGIGGEGTTITEPFVFTVGGAATSNLTLSGTGIFIERGQPSPVELQRLSGTLTLSNVTCETPEGNTPAIGTLTITFGEVPARPGALDSLVLP